MDWKHHEPDTQMLVWPPSVGSCDMTPQPLKDEKLQGQMEERLARRKCVICQPYFSSSLCHLNGMREAGLINSEQNEFNHFVGCVMIHTPKMWPGQICFMTTSSRRSTLLDLCFSIIEQPVLNRRSYFNASGLLCGPNHKILDQTLDSKVSALKMCS